MTNTINGTRQLGDWEHQKFREDSSGKPAIAVVNGNGADITTPTSAYNISAISEDATYKYYFFEDKSLNWYVMRKHLTNIVYDYTKGTGGYVSVYVDSTSAPSGSPTYASYGGTF